MFGRKVLISMIIIIMIVLLISNVVIAANLMPDPRDFLAGNPPLDGEAVTTNGEPVSPNLGSIIGRCIFPLILEIANLIISIRLLLKNKIRKIDCIFVILLSGIMIFPTIIFWNYNHKYSILGSILSFNIIVQIVIIICCILKMFKKEGEKKCQE